MRREANVTAIPAGRHSHLDGTKHQERNRNVGSWEQSVALRGEVEFGHCRLRDGPRKQVPGMRGLIQRADQVAMRRAATNGRATPEIVMELGE